MSTSSLQLAATGTPATITRMGIRLDGDLTKEEWVNLLTSLQCVKHAYHNTLADVLNYGRKKFGQEAVTQCLEQLEFELADVTKADAIGKLDYDFRLAYPLTSEHYFVLSHLEEPARSKWAKIAEKQKLSALELKRSIEAGKVLRLAEIQANSGQSTGINTIQGVVFRMQQWQQSMGGTEKILHLPIPERQNLLTLLTPAIELAAKLEQSLTADVQPPPARPSTKAKDNSKLFDVTISTLTLSPAGQRRKLLEEFQTHHGDKKILALANYAGSRAGTSVYVQNAIASLVREIKP